MEVEWLQDDGPRKTVKDQFQWNPQLATDIFIPEIPADFTLEANNDGYIESFNGKLRDDVLNREVFYSVKEAKVIVESWRLEYNNHRPHSRLGYMTPAAFAASCNPPGSAALRLPDCRTRKAGNSLIKVGT